MSRLESIKAAKSLNDVAELLDFKPKAVSFILYIKDRETKYHSFEIVKRNGQSRQINAPSPDLKLLQRRLSDLLQDCIEEINAAGKYKDQLSHGFKRRRSIITNATKHRKRKYVFNIDLQDFFGTINFGRVRGFFLKDKNFLLAPRVATVLAQIACHQNSLPQGSPCSPVISNLIGHVLDIHLVGLAWRSGCTYSRYADDITFSTNKPLFPPGIARRLEHQNHNWELGEEVREILVQSGFAINPEKTRMQYRTSRQDVTGLVVNSKVNVRAEYRHRVRAMADRLFRTGHFDFVQTVRDENGSFRVQNKEGTLDQLHGMLGHINSVDRHNAELRLRDQSASDTSIRGTSSKEHLYRRFLIFKEFHAALAPVVICEGKTDNVYVSHAIKKLAAAYPKLATVSAENTVSLKARVFRYPQTSTGRILGLNGGTGDFPKFISHYLDEIRKFKAPGGLQPVILLVDNDSGGKPVYNHVRQITKKNVTGEEPFIHIAENLYLVSTPLKKGEKKSVIEDSFTGEIRQLELGGKTLSLTNKFDPAKYYSKAIFSRYIEANVDKIDFAGFAEILTRLSAVIDAHRKEDLAEKQQPK